jgi:hypothetical protein
MTLRQLLICNGRPVAMAFVAVAAFASTAAAQTTLLFDNFDGYADQAALEAVWTPFPNASIVPSGVHPSLTLSTEQAVSPTQSLKNPGVTTLQGTAESPRNQRFFLDSGLPAADNLVHFEFDFYDSYDTGGAASVVPYRAYSGFFNSAAPSSSGGLVQMGMNNNQSASNSGGNYYMGRVFGYDPVVDGEQGTTGNGAFFKLNGVGTGDPGAVPLRSVGWHKLGVTVSDLDFKFYVDNILARVVDRADGFNSTTITVRSFDEIRLGAGVSNNNNASFVDNVSVVLNPVVVTPMFDAADFDHDNDVDAIDLGTLQSNFGTGTTNAQGDASGDMIVDGQDLLIWQRQADSGAISVAAVGAVPEPASAGIVAVALLGLGARRRR